MDKKIKICFIGTVNAMPMMYAKLFRENNYSVKYIVDVPVDNQLSRPENHFQDITYPYASWIKEIVIKRPSVRALFPKLLFRSILKEASDCNVFFLNDWYISLAPFLPKNSYVIVLPHGADLDTWCNPKMVNSISKVGLFKSLSFIKKILANIVINNMRNGLRHSNVVTYFPEGFNSDADYILNECSKYGKEIVRRYDVDTTIVDLESINDQSGDSKSALFNICSAVRFDYISRSGVENKYLKGNDIIIKGIARFYREVSKDINVVFFEKGQDVAEAKKLCEEYGIHSVVQWKKTVPLDELLGIMFNSDVCFDQVGSHWIGAVGVYALLLDKPLIANYPCRHFSDNSSDTNPILKSESADEVFDSLKLIFDRKCSGYKDVNVNRVFALEFFGAERVFKKYKLLIEDYFNSVVV